MSVINIISQAMKPKRFKVMAKKVFTRLKEISSGLDRKQNTVWLKKNLTDFPKLAHSINPQLWQEAQDYEKQCSARAQVILSKLDFSLGGGGFYPLLYFVTRLIQPQTIVETGVAAGFSSNAFLTAIQRNGSGKLYSSDFPYFRIKNPEKYIGIIVDDELKKNWTLLLDGDEANLPVIVSAVAQVDLFHYDSDKSYSGRANAIKLLARKFNERSIIIIDDIQDNNFFHDYISKQKPKHWYIFEFNGKFIGLIGDLSLVT